MRLFSSPHWTRCSHISRMALVVSVMLASVQFLAQAKGKAKGKEGSVEHPTSYRLTRNRWALYLLPRGWSKGRAGAAPPAWTPVFHRECSSLS